MTNIATLFSIVVAALHFWFFILETLLWTKPMGLRTFRNTLEKAQITRVLAANQGLYNSFLAIGICWSFVIQEPSFALQIRFFFLSCVAIAGVFGAWTVNVRIFFVQALPALIGILALILS